MEFTKSLQEGALEPWALGYWCDRVQLKTKGKSKQNDTPTASYLDAAATTTAADDKNVTPRRNPTKKENKRSELAQLFTVLQHIMRARH